MLSNKQSARQAASAPRDSLSPLDRTLFNSDDLSSRPAVELKRGTEDASSTTITSLPSPVRTQASETQQTRNTCTFHVGHEVATNSPTACSPRSRSLLLRTHLPSALKLTTSNGLSTLSIAALKQRIGNGNTQAPTAIEQRSGPETAASGSAPSVSPTARMGNKPSSLNGDPDDDASLRSVVRRPIRVLRKSSTHLFKHADSNAKSPLPRPTTATAIIVHANDLDRSLDDTNTDSPTDPFLDPAYAARDSVIAPLNSASTTATLTNESSIRPLSDATTIRDLRDTDASGSHFVHVEGDGSGESGVPPTVPAHRSSALSPTIPAPSPLPEDSPHKYGLKDRASTPSLVVDPPDDIVVAKTAKRRSTGPEIFNEAKSLESAKSFLNHLSTSRRRAESQHRTTSGYTTNYTNNSSSSLRPYSRPSSRPASTRPNSALNLHARPSAANLQTEGRHLGHNFKSNGFAYARPLAVTQLKCYRNHSRLLLSRNKYAPVECGVCHMDDGKEHFTCTWCAIRMCGYCRREFAERGAGGLQERVRIAEFGDGMEGSSGSEVDAAPGGRGRGWGRRGYS